MFVWIAGHCNTLVGVEGYERALNQRYSNSRALGISLTGSVASFLSGLWWRYEN